MVGLTRWDPFAELATLRDQMNRMFDDRFFRVAGPASAETTLAQFAPPVDVFENEDGIRITAELPGVQPEDVQVKVEDGTLTISGHRKLDKEDQRENYHRIERTYGSFLRSFTLPPTVDVEKIQAENRHGVLTIQLPRRQESKPRTIDVKVH